MNPPLPARTPEHLAPLLRAAEALDRAGRVREAIDAYREIVVGRPPQSLPSVSRLVGLLEASGRKDEAVRMVMDLAALWQRTGFVIQARVMWIRATWIAPDDPAPLLGLARAPLSHGTRPVLRDRALFQDGYERLLAAGRTADAAELKAAASFGPEDVVERAFERRMTELQAVADAGRSDEAVAIADRIALETDRVEVQACLRDVYATCGDFARAAAMSRTVAEGLRAQGRTSEAVAEGEGAAALDPARPAVWIKSARRHLRDGRAAEALRALDRALPLAAAADLAEATELASLATALNDAPGGMPPLRVPPGVAGLEIRLRAGSRSWLHVGAAPDATLCVPRGWELKVRLGGVEEDPGRPSDLAQWPAGILAELDLSFTRIDDADLAHVARFHDLRRLSLDCVDMAWGLVPMQSKIGLNVSRLFDDVQGRGVTSAGVAHLAGLTELRHLELGTTGIDDAALPHLVRMGKLEVLQLNRTGVEGHGLRYLVEAAIPLRELDLSRSRLSIAALETLAGLPHLEVLHLDGMLVDGARLAALTHLPLHTLTVSRSTVIATDVGVFANLRRLDLSGTDLDGAGARALASLPHLALLAVGDTDFGDEGLLEVARMPSLRRVCGGAAQFSDTAVARARMINPRLVVERTGQMLQLGLDDEREEFV